MALIPGPIDDYGGQALGDQQLGTLKVCEEPKTREEKQGTFRSSRVRLVTESSLEPSLLHGPTTVDKVLPWNVTN